MNFKKNFLNDKVKYMILLRLRDEIIKKAFSLKKKNLQHLKLT